MKQISSRYDIQQTDSGPAIIYRSEYTDTEDQKKYTWKQRTEQVQKIRRKQRTEDHTELNIINDQVQETKKLISVSIGT